MSEPGHVGSGSTERESTLVFILGWSVIAIYPEHRRSDSTACAANLGLIKYCHRKEISESDPRKQEEH